MLVRKSVEDGEETVMTLQNKSPFLFETEKELMSIAMRLKRVRDRFMVFLQEIKDAGVAEENLHIRKCYS